MSFQQPPPFKLDMGTGLSLALAFALMPAAQFLASISLHSTVPKKLYWIFCWFAYDCLTHSLLESAYLYHCFFSYKTIGAAADFPHPASISGPHFLGHAHRKYGSFYSDAPMARLWQEYAKADRRWGEADLTIICLEILTVFGAGPAAAYICYLIAQSSHLTKAADAARKSSLEATLWFVAIVVSTGELYGGFMTFAPEWLSANSQLATDDFVYMWLYLVFFNILWVFIPFWVLYEGFIEVKAAFARGAGSTKGKKKA